MGGYLACGGRLVELHADIVFAIDAQIRFIVSVVVIGVQRVAFPVVLNCATVIFKLIPSGRMIVNHIIVHIISAGHVPVDRVAFGISRSPDGDLRQFGDIGGRSTLQIIAHHVYLATTRTSITAVGIIDHAVAVVHVLGLNGILPFVFAVELVASVTGPVITSAIETG